MSDGITSYGFAWGPLMVQRSGTIDRGRGPCRILELSTPNKRLNIYVSPTGRSLRVFDGKGRELK